MALKTVEQMQEIVQQVSLLDKKFAPLIDRRPLCTLGRVAPSETHFQSLVSSVISQQLAVKAAATIHGRLEVLCKQEITPKRIIKLSDPQLREIGVSGAKTRTIKGLAQLEIDKTISVNKIDQIHDDQAIIDSLTSVWGIGRWTVEMFLIFQLGRLNIWPTGDLAVRRGWDLIHNNSEETSPKDLEIKGEKLRPYRSVAAWYCYQAVHESRGLDD